MNKEGGRSKSAKGIKKTLQPAVALLLTQPDGIFTRNQEQQPLKTWRTFLLYCDWLPGHDLSANPNSVARGGRSWVLTDHKHDRHNVSPPLSKGFMWALHKTHIHSFFLYHCMLLLHSGSRGIGRGAGAHPNWTSQQFIAGQYSKKTKQKM